MNEIILNNALKGHRFFLLGFMATGKTTIGKKLCSKLEIPFLDSDKEIESYLKMPISKVFNLYGEKKFRETEEKIILDIINNNNLSQFVMSLGGGAYLNNNIRKLVNSNGITIWLNATFLLKI